MAQVLKLKRTAVQGKVPNTSNLELGELAINTYDGRLFFEKDDGSPSVQEILTTGGPITGSLLLSGSVTIQGDVTATSFSGDGSGLTNLNVTASVAEEASVTASFETSSVVSVTHGFDSRNIHVSVYDDFNSQIIPQTVTLITNDSVEVTFSSPETGYIVVAKGGHILSGSQPISEETTVTASYSDSSDIDVNHNFGTKNVFVSVYNSLDKQIIPTDITLTDDNNVNITLSESGSGFVVVGKSGHLVQGTSTNADQLDSQDGTYYLDFTNFTSVPSGLVSGSDQLTGSYDIRYALSGSTGVSDYTQLTNIPSGIVSGSDQLTSSYDSRYQLSGSTGVSSFDELTDNPFTQSATEITSSKSIVPSTSDLDLGTSANPWRDLYLSSASLYIDGNQVISSTTDVLTVTTTNGQSIKLLEGGSDDIILQTENGNIELKGTVEITSGKKIVDSSATEILFGDSLGITGSISLTGTVDGVDISTFKSDYDTLSTSGLISGSVLRPNGDGVISGSSQVVYTDLSSIPAGIVSGSTQITDGSDLVSGSVLRPNGDGVVSGSSQVDLTQTTNYESGIKTKLDTEGVLSGSTVNGNLTVTGDFTVQGTTTTIDTTTLNIEDNIIELNYGGSATIAGIYTKDPTAPNTTSGSLLWDGTNDYWIAGQSGSESKVLLSNGDDVFSGSFNDVPNNPFSSSSTEITVTNNIIPDSNEVYDLGSPTNRFRDLYLSGSSVFLGDTKLSRDDTGNLEVRDRETNNLKKLRVDELELGQGESARRMRVNNGRFEFVDNNDSKLEGADQLGLTGVITGSSQITYTELSGIPSGIVSGSSQINYGGLNGIPSGIVSGSSQISYTGLTGIPSNIVSGSDQLTSSLDLLYVQSGSVSSDWTNITNKPTGLLSSSVVTIDGSGNMTVNTITETSALRYKKYIKPIEDGSIIDELRPVSFTYKKSTQKEYGFIAEEVNELDELLTTRNDDGEIEGLKYTKIIPLLVKKVQDQQKEIDELKEIIKNGNS